MNSNLTIIFLNLQFGELRAHIDKFHVVIFKDDIPLIECYIHFCFFMIIRQADNYAR